MTSIYRKMKLLFRATAEAPVRELVAANDISIFEQELYDAEQCVKRGKLHLAHIKAELKMVDSHITELKQGIQTRETQAIQALDKDPLVAEELAALIAEDEIQLKLQCEQKNRLANQEVKVTQELTRAARSIQSHRKQLGFMRANQHSIKASKQLQGKALGLQSTLCELNESLQSINERQTRAHHLDEANREVEEQLNGDVMTRKLSALGIREGQHGAQEVLERLKQRSREET